MHLYELLENISELKNQEEYKSVNILGVTCDSRLVKKDYMFIAIAGVNIDGKEYIPNAILSGAKVIITDAEDLKILQNNYPDNIFIKSQNIRLDYSLLAAKFYSGQPKNIVAVTGTNGKTSVVNFYAQIIALLGQKSCSIGTIGIIGGDNKNLLADNFGLTTPNAEQLHQTFAKLVAKNIDYLAMEASSHGLSQYRLHGVKINAAAFTNLSRDHIDYHKDEADYFAAKMKLFNEVLPRNKVSIINADSEYANEVIKICKKREQKIFTFGIKGSDIKILGTKQTIDKQQIDFLYNNIEYKISTDLIGSFQASNLLCALSLVINSNIDSSKAINILSQVQGVPGRMEKVICKNNKNLNVVVDYAHTPDGLLKALSELKNLKENKLWVIFGCGGNRDKGKRILMGEIAAKLADKIIVTDDNPRNEDASEIRKQVIAGCKDAIEIADREKAIAYAIENAENKDIILLAGKGHEKYQIIGEQKIPFDDVDIALKELKKYSRSSNDFPL